MLELLVTVLVLFVFLALLAAIALVVRARYLAGAQAGEWPFNLRKPLTAPEQVLYFRLRDALPDHIVLAQVGLSRFLGVKRGNDARAWNNRINRMSIDFLVCNKDASVVAAIELDDASHHRPDRASADIKKEKALGAAGVHLLRWSVESMPDDSAIRRAIASGSGTPSRAPSLTPQSKPTNYRPA